MIKIIGNSRSHIHKSSDARQDRPAEDQRKVNACLQKHFEKEKSLNRFAARHPG